MCFHVGIAARMIEQIVLSIAWNRVVVILGICFGSVATLMMPVSIALLSKNTASFEQVSLPCLCEYAGSVITCVPNGFFGHRLSVALWCKGNQNTSSQMISLPIMHLLSMFRALLKELYTGY